jgi:hypothetical protein
LYGEDDEKRLSGNLSSRVIKVRILSGVSSGVDSVRVLENNVEHKQPMEGERKLC